MLTNLLSRTLSRARIAMVLALCAIPAHAQPEGQGGRGLRVPRAIGEFRLIRSRQLDSASGGGFALRYARADTLGADVFVYPGPDFGTDCATECAQRLLASEGDGFVRAIPILIERKFIDSATVLGDSVLTAVAGTPWKLGRRITLNEVRNGQPAWSDLYLFYIERVRIKVRATYPREPARADAIATFALAVVAAMRAPEAPGEPPPEASAARSP